MANRINLETDPLKTGIQKFVHWLDSAGYASFDPYDIWGTRFGLYARRLYYQKNPAGYALVAPILFLETIAPGLRFLFAKKARFATADAQLVLAFLNLHQTGFAPPGSSTWLDRAKKLGDELLGYSIPGFHGHCWGYPFDWQNNRGMWPRNTPYITCTPYCFQAFVGLYEATGEGRYADIARSIANFVHEDLMDTETGPDAAAASYSPLMRDKVVNATAYRAWVLFEAAHRLNLPQYLEKARKNLNFILQSQRDDGAWLYAVDDPKDAFIDHFHTCFVLKNLYRINLHLKDDRIQSALARGWQFYQKALFYDDGLPKYYACKPRTEIVQLEMYNLAEAITLGALLKDEFPGALPMARRLSQALTEKYQLPDGHFVTRVYRGGIRHTFPFLRWPQAQLFYALTNLLAVSGV